jgi:hypothetical protein
MARNKPPQTPLGPLDYRRPDLDAQAPQRIVKRSRWRYLRWFRIVYLIVTLSVLAYAAHYLLNYIHLINQLSRP